MWDCVTVFLLLTKRSIPRGKTKCLVQDYIQPITFYVFTQTLVSQFRTFGATFNVKNINVGLMGQWLPEIALFRDKAIIKFCKIRKKLEFTKPDPTSINDLHEYCSHKFFTNGTMIDISWYFLAVIPRATFLSITNGFVSAQWCSHHCLPDSISFNSIRKSRNESGHSVVDNLSVYYEKRRVYSFLFKSFVRVLTSQMIDLKSRMVVCWKYAFHFRKQTEFKTRA